MKSLVDNMNADSITNAHHRNGMMNSIESLASMCDLEGGISGNKDLNHSSVISYEQFRNTYHIIHPINVSNDSVSNVRSDPDFLQTPIATFCNFLKAEACLPRR